MGSLDVVIPVHPKDRAVLRHSLRGVLSNVVDLGRVFLVSPEPVTSPDRRVVCVAEPSLPRLPAIEDVRRRWRERAGGAEGRVAWIYQQLLKLGAGSYIEDLSPAYMAMDADVIFLRPTRIIEPDVRFPFTRAIEYHEPYRDAYERLLGTRPPAGHSFVTHQMLFDRAMVSELQREIEQRHGVPWYWAFVDATGYEPGMPISEWETYGHWMLTRHPEHTQIKQLAWRNVPCVPTPLGRAILGKDHHFVAAHHYGRTSRSHQATQVGRLLSYYAYRRLIPREHWLERAIRRARNGRRSWT